MSENYSKELCEERHKQLEDTLELHNKRLNDYSKRIDDLEQDVMDTGHKLKT